MSIWRFISPYKASLVAIIGLIILLAYYHHSGIGISPDSVQYLSTARNLLETGRFDNFHHQPLIDFPIGYPLALAEWEKLGLWLHLNRLSLHAELQMTALLNLILFAWLMVVADVLLRKFRMHPIELRLGLLTIWATSPCLLEIYSYAWSETLFLPLMLSMMVYLLRYLDNGSMIDFFIAALLAACAWVTRYAGVALVGLSGIYILFTPTKQRYSWVRRGLHGWIWGIIGLSLVGVNLYRNHITGGFVTGMREKSLSSFVENLRQAGEVLAGWWPVFTSGIGLPLVLSTLLVSLLLGIAYMRKKNLAELVMLSFGVGYLLFMVIIASITRFQTLDSRLLSPAYIPLMAGLAGSYERVYAFMKKISLRLPIRRVVSTIFILIWIAFQVNNGIMNAENYDGIKDAGIPGYTEDGWTQSPTMLYLCKHLARCVQITPWYSDADDAIYWFTRKQAVLLPHRENPCERQQFQDAPQAIIFWFNDAADDDLISQRQIEQLPDVHIWKRFDDGIIYLKGNIHIDSVSNHTF
ncbi:MAG: glycosyltransferase family 39 protein [Thermoflavifilum sp.]|nr:glycosyltransferase family 39 protein [Thermoflavifilum sp.]